MATLDSYAFTVGRPIDMDEAIYFLTPTDAPLLGAHTGDGVPVLPKQGVSQTRFYWMEEEGLLPRTTLTGTHTNAVTTINIATGTGTRFMVGDLLRVHNGVTDETMRVTAVAASSLTVTRAFAGTAAAYTAGQVVISVGQALAEGSAPGESRQLGRTEEFNYTQIAGPLKASITRTEEATMKYGVSSEKAHQIMRRIQEATVTREQGLLYAPRVNDLANKIRSSGGLTTFLTQNVDTASGALSVAKIEALQALCYARGGVPSVLIVNPGVLGTLNDLANTGRVRTDLVDTRRGRMPVRIVTTEYGDVTIVRHRWVDIKDGFMIEPGAITRRVMTPLQMTPLAKVSDSDDVMIVGEEGLQVKGGSHMGRFSALTA